MITSLIQYSPREESLEEGEKHRFFVQSNSEAQIKPIAKQNTSPRTLAKR